MAVKGKELNKIKKLDMKIVVGIIILVVAYIVFQQTVMTKVFSNPTAYMAFNIGMLVIMVGLFAFVFIRQFQVYLLTLTNKDFEIDKKGLIGGKCVLFLLTSSFLGLKKAENYDESTAGKPLNCTIKSIEEEKETFVLIYKEGKEKKSVKFQCSVKFYNELKILVLNNQKAMEKNAKKKK